LIEFTGERVIPGQTDPDLLNEHIARYRFAEALAGARSVLDAGCGVAYGSAILASRASVVYGLDNSGEALRQGAESGLPANVRLLEGDCAAFPLRDASTDLVVAFEVIEHLPDHRRLLAEARRVLRSDGQLIVSTPNRPYYEQSRSEPNPFHVHEFDYEEFRAALEEFFPHTTIFLENHTQAIAFTPLDVQGLRTRLDGAPPDPSESHFFVAVCSPSPLYGSPAFIFVPEAGNVLRDREQHISLLTAELATKTSWLEETKQQLEEMTQVNLEEQRKAQQSVDKLEAQLAEKIAWAEKADRAVEKARLELDRMRQEFEQRTAWAKQIEAQRDQTVKDYAALEAEADKRSAELQKAILIIDELEARVAERTNWAKSLQARLEAIYSSPAYRWGRRLRLTPDRAE
jgi:SAM-dependent methyltransferase